MTQCVDKEIQSVAFLQGKRCAGPGPALPTPVRSGFQNVPSQAGRSEARLADFIQRSEGEEVSPHSRHFGDVPPVSSLHRLSEGMEIVNFQ